MKKGTAHRADSLERMKIRQFEASVSRDSMVDASERYHAPPPRNLLKCAFLSLHSKRKVV